MNNQLTISEKELLASLQCPLRGDAFSVKPESPMLSCAEKTLGWLTSELRAGRQPTAKETRDFFEGHWEQTAYRRSQVPIPPKQYRRDLTEIPRACSRLRDLVWSHEILQAVEPYQLTVGGVVITGEYMVLQSPRQKKHAYIPYLRYRGVKIRPMVPDVAAFARWLHASNRWMKSIPQHWGIQSVGILHYWVTQNLAALHEPEQGLARKVVTGAAGVLSGPPFPIPGDHCLSCPTRACNAEGYKGNEIYVLPRGGRGGISGYWESRSVEPKTC